MPRALTRRAFLSRAAIGGAGLVAAACGGPILASPTASPDRSATPAPTNAASPTPGVDLRRRLAGLLVAGFRGTTVGNDDPVIRAIRDEGLGGVVLFDRNIRSPEQLGDLTAALHAAAGSRRLIVCVDQEGGRVARLGPANGFEATPSAAEVGARGDSDYARSVGAQIGRTLRRYAINLDLAPVVDVDVNPSNPSIGALGRSYSADPAIVAGLAAATIDGLHANGVGATLKHFPGLGSATGNTDFEFVDVSATWSTAELLPYRRLIADGRADVVMTANALNAQLDGQHPASLSATTLKLLRDQLGFEGVAMTDDLNAGALVDSYPRAEILRLALGAGNDLLLFAKSAPDDRTLVGGILDTLVDLVTRGRIAEDRIAQAYARVVSLLARL